MLTTYFVSDFRLDLVQFYKEKRLHMPLTLLRPDLDENIDELYVQPQISVVQTSRKITDPKVKTGVSDFNYKNIFEIGNLKNIYIQGNAGTGKTTFSTKLTLDWCKIIQSKAQFPNMVYVENYLKFDFLFLIPLREIAGDVCQVENLIEELIISEMANQSNYKHEFLLTLLGKERCLTILDGLDEWYHPETDLCRRQPKIIPHRGTGGKSVYLTLTRPWKLYEISLEDSNIDLLLEINGVKDNNQLAERVLTCLNRREDKSKSFEKFKSATLHLTEILQIPIMTKQIVCLWFENGLIPDTRCSIFSTMVKLMLRKVKNWTDSQHVNSKVKKIKFSDPVDCEHYTHFEEQLGRLSFETLYPDDDESNILVLFSSYFVERYLNRDIWSAALSSGILTEYKMRSYSHNLSQVSFPHSTFQEFFAVRYLVLKGEEGEKMLPRILKRKFICKNLTDVSNLFVFLCGMKPTLASRFAEAIKPVIRDRLYNEFYDMPDISIGFEKLISSWQLLFNAGYTECLKNAHSVESLTIGQMYFSKSAKPDEDLMPTNSCNVENAVSLFDEFDQTVLNTVERNAKFIKTVVLRKLHQDLDLNACENLQQIRITPFTRCRVSKNGDTDKSYYDLNLKSCNKVEYLGINQRGLSVYIDGRQLKSCILSHYDFQQGNLANQLLHADKN